MVKDNKTTTIIITKAIKKKIQHLGIKYNIIYKNEPKNLIMELIKKRPKKIIIYDITSVEKEKPFSIIEVSDHINKTGENPLIGNQKIIKNNFIDIRKIYNKESKTITVGLGRFYGTKHGENYPSTYLCNIAIIAQAVGVKQITGRLINIIKKTNRKVFD